MDIRITPLDGSGQIARSRPRRAAAYGDADPEPEAQMLRSILFLAVSLAVMTGSPLLPPPPRFRTGRRRSSPRPPRRVGLLRTIRLRPVPGRARGSLDTEAECADAGRGQRFHFTCRHEWWEIEYRWRLWVHEGDPVARNAIGRAELVPALAGRAAGRPAVGRQRPDWEFETSYYRHAWCAHAGANGFPRYWTACQCRTVHLGGGDVFRYGLWVCHRPSAGAEPVPETAT